MELPERKNSKYSKNSKNSKKEHKRSRNQHGKIALPNQDSFKTDVSGSDDYQKQGDDDLKKLNDEQFFDHQMRMATERSAI